MTRGLLDLERERAKQLDGLKVQSLPLLSRAFGLERSRLEPRALAKAGLTKGAEGDGLKT